LGAVPNPRNRSVVTKANSRQNVIATRTGMSVVMGSDGGSGGVAGGGSATARVATPSAYGPGPDMTTPDAFGAEPVVTANDLKTPPQLSSATLGTGSNYIALNVNNGASKIYNTRMGARPTTPIPGDIPPETDKTTIKVTGYEAPDSKTINPPVVKNYNLSSDGIFHSSDGPFYTKATGQIVLESNSALIAKATEIDISATGHIRMYADAKDAKITMYADSISQTSKSSLQLVDGIRQSTVESDSRTIIKGNRYTRVDGKLTEEWYTGNKHNYMMGGTINVVMSGVVGLTFGTAFNMAVGVFTNINVGTSLGLNLGIRFTYIGFKDIKVVTGMDLKLVFGSDVKWTPTAIDLSKTDWSLGIMAGSMKTIKAAKETINTEVTQVAAAKKAVAASEFLAKIGQSGPDVESALLKLIT
jgi:hypothetical protein